MDVESLYKRVEELESAGESATEHLDAFQQILSAVDSRSNPQTRQLAAQLIPRFARFFPKEDALNPMLDLCEDEESMAIRVQAIRGLALLCKDIPDNSAKIANVLTQLLTAETQLERSSVKKSFDQVFKLRPQEVLDAFFNQVERTEDDAVRAAAIGFAVGSLRAMVEEMDSAKGNFEISTHFLGLVRKVVRDVSGAEYERFVSSVRKMKIVEQNEKYHFVVDIIGDQLELALEEFSPSDAASANRVIAIMNHISPFMAVRVDLSKVLVPIAQRVFPKVMELSPATRTSIARLFAESSSKVNTASAAACFPHVIDLVVALAPSSGEIGEENLELSILECLMYSFHKLARKIALADVKSFCGLSMSKSEPGEESGEPVEHKFPSAVKNLLEYAEKYIKELELAREMQSDDSTIREALLVTRSIVFWTRTLVKERPLLVLQNRPLSFRALKQKRESGKGEEVRKRQKTA